jgi:hypothetical protein
MVIFLKYPSQYIRHTREAESRLFQIVIHYSWLSAPAPSSVRYILVIAQQSAADYTHKALFPTVQIGNEMTDLSTRTLEPKPADAASCASSTGSTSHELAHSVGPSAAASSTEHHPTAGFASWLSSNTTGYQGLDQKPLADLIAQHGSSSSTAWLDSERYKIWRPCQPIPESDFAPAQGYIKRCLSLLRSPFISFHPFS